MTGNGHYAVVAVVAAVAAVTTFAVVTAFAVVVLKENKKMWF